MASITSEIASSSSSLPKWEYDVFLSFRGEDTRNNFTDHLYAALDRKGIWTFRDDERLERGKLVSPELLNAIEKSKFAIIVLSRNYVFSSWCLDELVKIVECKEETRLTILSVFYGVDPSDVRKQTGSFADAFAKHEELIKNEEKLQSWRAALTQVANLSGWDTRNNQQFVEEIARKLIGGLHYSYSGVHEDLVGIESRVEEMENLYLSMGLNDVHFIGIWGMGGIGKTTIAQVLYDRIRYHFAGSSFLANVRERSRNDGLVSLQKRLLFDVLSDKNIDISDVQWGINLTRNRLCHKRVLVILDDVDQPKQLEALVGKQSWFGQGSVIIIITRDQHLLITHEVAEEKIYTPEILNSDEALKLFSLKAFKQDSPSKGYEALSENFIYYAQGLPLALKVLGSFMFNRNLDAWESELGRLKKSPEWEILDVLRISFDGLRITEKKVFLDIACFFKGMTKDHVASILRTPHYRPNIDIDVLVEKSLIIISNGTLWMHDLIQELGKEIVRCESLDEPGGCSRLWHKEDILRVLKDNTGTKKVEGIFINTPSKEEDLNVEEKVEDLNAETFSEMRNLSLLKICNVGLPQGLNSLSSDLRLMNWPKCPLKFLPKNFNPNKLVKLIMPCSLIKQLWEGNWSLEWLRIIDLSDSKELIMTLDFARVPKLEELILKGCTKLSVIHPPLGDLKHLILLDLSNCKCLKRLPCKISWESLKFFILSGCSKLKKFPEIVGNMSRLQELYLDETTIEDLPLSMEQLTRLIKLDLTNCKTLSSLPCKISWESLEIFILSGCSKLKKFPEIVENMSHLLELCLDGIAVEDLPLSMEQLTGLTTLDLTNCKNLSSFPGAICSLTSLKTLILSRCSKLHKMEENLGNLEGLEILDMSGTSIRDLPLSMEQLTGLIKLDLTNCKKLSSLPRAICSLTSLKTLTLSGCSKLHKM
ncbi:hypothetical protein SO802_005838 [Lithocarpus litseifolius]|uniref:TIR domain-containing protein n=1 Tax=Lithocarpus litseifolius TaxID=425828 RepID=A0AAW2DN56_9ROSI